LDGSAKMAVRFQEALPLSDYMGESGVPGVEIIKVCFLDSYNLFNSYRVIKSITKS